MTTTNSFDNNIETHPLNEIDKDSLRTNYSLTDGLITTIDNNEVYEKARPLKRITKVLNKELVEDQAHGDDTHTDVLRDPEKSFELFSHESQPNSNSTQKQTVFESKSNIRQIHFIEHVSANDALVSIPSQLATSIPPMSSSSDEFSLEMVMPVIDTSNEALKTDDENGMTKPYFISQRSNYNKKDHVSLQQQQQKVPQDECEYEIDLGNGWITKSISSYQSNDKQQRTTSVISADSIQPIATFKIPFTNTRYEQHIRTKQENPIDQSDEPNILFNSHDYTQSRWLKFSLQTVAIMSIGTAITVLIIIVVFFVF